MWYILFNACGSDSLLPVDGRFSLNNVHNEAKNIMTKWLNLKDHFLLNMVSVKILKLLIQINLK